MFFFDDEREKLRGNMEILKEGNVIADKVLMQKFVDEYITKFDLTMSLDDRFAQLKEI